MRSILLASLLMLAGCANTMQHSHRCAVRLAMGDGVCSGTIIGPHAILSATHCFDGSSVAVNGRPVRVMRRLDDGSDHTILLTDKTFRDWCLMGKSPT